MNYKLVKNYLDDKTIKWSPMREGAGLGMAELGEEKKDMVLLGADTIESCRAHYFAKKFPERTIECGVAEQNLIGVSAGLAYNGKVPYAVTYSPFLIGRPWEPIRTTIAYPNNHVVFVASHAGIATGSDGPTHQMTEDIALTRCLPNFTVICPCDHEQALKAVKAAYDLKGPVYVRCARGGSASGGKDSIEIEVINLHTIKPIDEKTIVKSAKKTGKVFTVEDHNIIGGMGSAVAELLGENHPVPIKIYGVMDQFTESGSVKDLWEKYKLDKDGIKKTIIKFLSK
ncbi:MAG: Transketolase central region [Candidatus Nomurabacteria bacterium GW2011_GWB1_37_5]|uniref:Transketolase central region n=1 Tax=Candidatus Nomurabacteria bacterium GW2011_GWB1_37_5 TaxID=1618742 RepID=A0A0G0JCA0_9BACT|nr:MAG: Transketolase central region [Candidatus Nomurabacteria bacterium GW2011_GWB1_37_5]